MSHWHRICGEWHRKSCESANSQISYKQLQDLKSSKCLPSYTRARRFPHLDFVLNRLSLFSHISWWKNEVYVLLLPAPVLIRQINREATYCYRTHTNYYTSKKRKELVNFQVGWIDTDLYLLLWGTFWSCHRLAQGSSLLVFGGFSRSIAKSTTVL